MRVDGVHAAAGAPPADASPSVAGAAAFIVPDNLPPPPPPGFASGETAGGSPAPMPPTLSLSDLDRSSPWVSSPPLPSAAQPPSLTDEDFAWPPATPPTPEGPGPGAPSVGEPSLGAPVVASASFTQRSTDSIGSAAPAGFDAADLTGDFAIGTPTEPSATIPNGITSTGPLGQHGLGEAAPAGPVGFSPSDLTGEFSLGAPPPPPPTGFASSSVVDFDLGLDVAPEPSAPPPPPGFGAVPAPGSAPSQPLPSAFQPGDFVGNDALGGKQASKTESSATVGSGGGLAPPPITPDFFARSGKRKH